MPTGELQATADILITLVYWYLHWKYLPYRTDWKDADGNPADPDLENNLQHYMYATQVIMVVAMLLNVKVQDDPEAGAALLLFIYFAGVAFLGYSIVRTVIRQKKRSSKIALANIGEEEEDKGKVSTSVLVVKKVFEGIGNS